MKIFKQLLRITRIALLVILAVYAGAALTLVNQSDPQFKPDSVPTAPAEMSEMFKQDYPNEPAKFTTRDRAKLFAQHFRADSNLTVIVIHGVLASSYLMNRTSGMLQSASGGEVFALDLRGHGQSTGRAGDVDYVDQYVDDLADVVAEIRRRKPAGRIVLAAFVAGQFEPVVTKYSAGQVILVDGATHNSICYNDQAMAGAGDWLAKNGLAETNLSVR